MTTAAGSEPWYEPDVAVPMRNVTDRSVLWPMLRLMRAIGAGTRLL